MRLVNKEYNVDVILEENKVSVFSLENTRMYSEWLKSLWNQYSGNIGEFILSEGTKELNISKVMDVVFNPFQLSLNNAKILKGLYKEIEELSVSSLYEKKAIMNQHILEYWQQVELLVDYPLDYSLEVPVSNLLKLFNFKIDIECSSLLENLVNYIQLMHRICRINVFCFVNLKLYLSCEDLTNLYKTCFYEEVFLILFEGRYEKALVDEKNYIFDKDLCTIIID